MHVRCENTLSTDSKLFFFLNFLIYEKTQINTHIFMPNVRTYVYNRLHTMQWLLYFVVHTYYAIGTTHTQLLKRKTRRQILAEREALAQQLVDKANSVTNPLDHLNFFHKYETPDNQTIEFFCTRATDAQPECLSWVFDIMERNMKSLYEECDWGWDPVAKQQELTEPTAWYLVASLNNTFVGFSHFRFTMDHREEVLYCYEIQLESEIRRKGLGHFIMSALESMALESKMRKVVVTVFKHNPSAMQFFYSLGYKLDKTSPSVSNQLHYIILSKAVDAGSMSKKPS
ncbi:N-alpha-acetyltransferase 40 isoform X1 [Hylaeus anthracinus]|uniref:N-alpha-acetyltransferase 40 isoform X1 n=1 Tax=Hylaeus anthracinus TaxID=313031 RepID=UPI0023B88842|nr:N-alpha-acetyltransferase 40 isoform X1 [Hylaeus anthracinus]